MATKNEKILGSVLGAFVGVIIGYILSEGENVRSEDRWKYVLGGAAAGGMGGYGLATLVGSKNDTVNYQLIDRNKNVYHGITFEDRVQKRKFEHIKSGKQFSQMIVDSPKPRVDAISLEKKLIKRDRPKYNIQHNG